jgi:2-polyprenyl-3-methyl-5-hydroxy-6-metoxy-1,4-benzoquinol methylase
MTYFRSLPPFRAMNSDTIASKYHFESAAAPHTAAYLTDHILAACRQASARKVLDLGCGNGTLCGALSAAGFEVVGCDPSEAGIEFARHTYPHIPFHRLGVYDDPALLGHGGFDLVVSTEVIEHIFLPRALPRFASKVLRKGGHLVLTTPYHGYIKNLALAISGKLDAHFTVLWDGGHIKFWSRATLSQLLLEEGFVVTGFIGAGRIPYLWKSMIVIAQSGA